MKERREQVGLDRLVRLIWLEKTTSLLLGGIKRSDLKPTLQQALKPSFRTSRTDVRGSIDKTMTILTKVWLTVPTGLEPLRLEGLDLLSRVPQRDRMAVHWGMVMAVYPFWLSVAVQVGRLLTIQGSAASVHVQRRIHEEYGERETVSRRTRYILRSYLDWGVLQETSTRGVYTAGTTLAIDNPRLIAWLAETSLRAGSSRSAPLRNLLSGPGLFPFRLESITAGHLASVAPRLDFLRHGLDDDLVVLRELEVG